LPIFPSFWCRKVEVVVVGGWGSWERPSVQENRGGRGQVMGGGGLFVHKKEK